MVGKAALARTHSKTWRHLGRTRTTRSFFECGTQFRFGLESRVVAPLDEFRLTPG
jgi:hypothetical protein